MYPDSTTFRSKTWTLQLNMFGTASRASAVVLGEGMIAVAPTTAVVRITVEVMAVAMAVVAIAVAVIAVAAIVARRVVEHWASVSGGFVLVLELCSVVKVSFSIQNSYHKQLTDLHSVIGDP